MFVFPLAVYCVFLQPLFAVSLLMHILCYVWVCVCVVHSSIRYFFSLSCLVRTYFVSIICLMGSISDNFFLLYSVCTAFAAAPRLSKCSNHSAYWLRDRKISVFFLFIYLHNHNRGAITTKTETQTEWMNAYDINAECIQFDCLFVFFGVNDVCR